MEQEPTDREPPEGGEREKPDREGSGDGTTRTGSGREGRGGRGGRRRKRRHERFRVPSIVMLVLGPAAGWIVADVPGAILGLVIGVVAWRSRA